LIVASTPFQLPFFHFLNQLPNPLKLRFLRDLGVLDFE
jgi:hypothetical protein